MAAYNKFDNTVEAWHHGELDDSADQYTVALTNAANPPTAADSLLADLTEISYANLSSRDLVTNTSSQTGGLYTQLFTDLVLTASGGPVAAFQYVAIFNQTSVGDVLIGWYDNGSEINLADGETLTIDFTTATYTNQ